MHHPPVACSVGRNCVHHTPTALTVRRIPTPEPKGHHIRFLAPLASNLHGRAASAEPQPRHPCVGRPRQNSTADAPASLPSSSTSIGIAPRQPDRSPRNHPAPAEPQSGKSPANAITPPPRRCASRARACAIRQAKPRQAQSCRKQPRKSGSRAPHPRHRREAPASTKPPS